MNYTKLTLTSKLKSLGFQLQDFMLVGIRASADKPNEWDDKIYLITKTGYWGFEATTNPGTHWLLNWMNPKGTAVLKPGMYWYKLGTHKGYEALVQAAPVTVYRDKNKDLKSDEIAGTEETGYFGVNVHRALESGLAKWVGQFSAGCQVIRNPADFKVLLEECKKSGLTKFPYYLIKE